MCYCGHNPGVKAEDEDSACNLPCPNNALEICGGVYGNNGVQYNSVFETGLWVYFYNT